MGSPASFSNNFSSKSDLHFTREITSKSHAYMHEKLDTSLNCFSETIRRIFFYLQKTAYPQYSPVTYN